MEQISIGSRIKMRRLELGLTQTQIKQATGISSGNLSEIENGGKLPSSPALINLSNVLECSIDWILKGDTLKRESDDAPDRREQLLLKMFRELDHDDQEELIDIVEIKLKRKKKGSGAAAKSSPYTEGGSGDMVG